MNDRRFDALAKALADRCSRRVALAGGIATCFIGLGAGDARLPGLAQDAVSPVASPLATPDASRGPLDLLTGTPEAGAKLIVRSDAGACKGPWETCPMASPGPDGAIPKSYPTTECGSGTCATTYRFGLVVGAVST